MSNKQLRIYDKEKYIKVSVDEAIARGYNKWKGWNCYAGLRNLYIDYDGNIFVCNTAGSKLNRFDKDRWIAFIREQGYPDISEEEKDKYVNEYNNQKDIYKRIVKVEENIKGFIGNIFSDLDLPKNHIICPFDYCSCGADVIVSKYKDDIYLPVTTKGYEGQQEGNFVETINNNSSVEMNFPIPYQVLWDLTRRCNYNCSYCWPAVHNKTESFIEKEIVFNVLDKLIKWSDGKEIRFNFGGGEPTLHPNFLEILSYLKSKQQWVLVTSNMSRSLNYWSECSKYINSINMSAHFESIDKNHFLNVLEIFIDRHNKDNDDHWIEVKLMTPPGKLEEVLEFKKEIEKLELHKNGANNRMKGTCSLVPIRGIEDSDNILKYSEKELKFFQNQ